MCNVFFCQVSMGSHGPGTSSSSSTTGVGSPWRLECPSLQLPRNKTKVSFVYFTLRNHNRQGSGLVFILGEIQFSSQPDSSHYYSNLCFFPAVLKLFFLSWNCVDFLLGDPLFRLYSVDSLYGTLSSPFVHQITLNQTRPTWRWAWPLETWWKFTRKEPNWLSITSTSSSSRARLPLSSAIMGLEKLPPCKFTVEKDLGQSGVFFVFF